MSRRRGITLILALLIVSVVVAIGITVSTVVIFQVRLNQVTAQSHQGYYAAESGIEQGLNRVASLQSQPLASALTTLQNLTLPSAPDANLDPTYFSNTKQYLSSSTAGGSSTTVPADLQEGQSTYVDIFNVDASLAALPTPPAEPVLCVSAAGKDADGSGTDTAGNEVLEVTWVAWDSFGQTSAPQRAFLSYSQFTGSNCIAQPGASVPITQFYPAFTPSAYAGFRIRITPLRPTAEDSTASSWGDVTNLSVTTNPAPNSQILLKSVSETGSQKQALKATFPWVLPLSSLFDFVIFSEQTLKKEVPITLAQDVRQFGPYAISGCTGIPVQCTIPATVFTTPNPDCSALNPCTYYVRLTAGDALGWQNQTGASVNTSGTGGSQSIPDLNAASCILKTPYLFAAGSGTITFTNKPANLVSYTLLTTPAFSSADEYYCP